ncbi:MAG: hypothetical protein JW927_20515 [Deltaproteobacteria bacterium]|nr:hypothetical protein [Deltaproteobacteria bacterium]
MKLILSAIIMIMVSMNATAIEPVMPLTPDASPEAKALLKNILYGGDHDCTNISLPDR